ncbi:protein of unknown function [Microlunatus sagamiharensis]|uniref:DUF222 domain-containing protein n=1 Tax=Microlunatus sagamiharensis TaxID=546874 RepID=A0A1H2MAF7_9ACTN|nr:DUF222 domain-containing protein [Microlunatus sagamiharensis]SDU89466.1 protein of unknown function [Microlunatus sagamiharensis]
MFDPETQGHTAAELCSRIAASHATLRETECEELVLAAAWADVHYLDGDEAGYRPLVERSCAWGGQGCPPVAEHCALELGALRGTGATAARMLIADALDLRHRLPHLWQLVRTGTVRAWQARHVAQTTHDLSWEACTDVDEALSRSLPLLAWPRFRRLLHAAVLDADPEARRRREQDAGEQRGVWSWTGDHGLRTVVAKAASGDAVWFMATVDRLAEVLRADGDTDPVDVRRSKAIGLLAQPALALALLLDHADDPDRLPPAQAPHAVESPAPGPATTARLDEDEDADPDGSGRDLVLRRDLLRHDLRAARPRVVLHLHVTDTALRCGDGLVRPEHGEAMTLDQARDWLADTGCPITVRPVRDPLDTAPVDAYEIPLRLREALFLRNPVDVFPFGQATSRTLDLDHTTPYVPPGAGGPPGQTGTHNLGFLARSHHRAVTFAGWKRRQPQPGTYLFASPNGYVYLTTNQGTVALGRTPYSRALWDCDPAEDRSTKERVGAA